MTTEVDRLIAGLSQRKIRDLARAITLVENGGPEGLELLARLAAGSSAGGSASRCEVIGITGSPGVGKSTMTDALIAAYRAAGKSVAVLAVDPSSPFSGGALLGDRVRMQSHSLDPEVFIRSMASRGHLGGLAAAAGQVLRVLDAAGFDVVLVETVGVGQSEVEVAAAADTTIVLLAPGMGDGIQAAKAGILEIGDVFVVNKADREGAQSTARDLRQMIAMATDGSTDGSQSWLPPVLTTIASTGVGIDEVVASIGDHRSWAIENGELERRRRARAREEVVATVVGMLQTRLDEQPLSPELEAVAAEVATGEVDVHGAASRLWKMIGR